VVQQTVIQRNGIIVGKGKFLRLESGYKGVQKYAKLAISADGSLQVSLKVRAEFPLACEAFIAREETRFACTVPEASRIVIYFDSGLVKKQSQEKLPLRISLTGEHLRCIPAHVENDDWGYIPTDLVYLRIYELIMLATIKINTINDSHHFCARP
jgi:hypothetical protein